MKRDEVAQPCDEGGEAPCLAHLFEDPAEAEPGPTDDVPEAMPSTPAPPRR